MEYFERHQGGERTLLVSVAVYMLDDIDLPEFKLLAESAGAQIIEVVQAARSKPDPQYFIGSGKLDEIKERVCDLEIDVVMVDHSLTPAQERNLERVLECRVMDRTRLILDIFALRARTYEGKLQVELAQLNHLASRLVRGWTHLERQKGGIGLRGPGETQLETDRRLLRTRVKQLELKIAKVRQTREQGRASRQKADIKTISLVGYTNAGKSTLFNRICKSDVYAANQLFATLDTTLRHIQWQGVGKVIVADTVGFVSNLPHALVDAFKATLEETIEADLILHVIDASSAESLAQMQAVNTVLAEIGANAPLIEVYNKIDNTPQAPGVISACNPAKVRVSALTGVGIDALQGLVAEMLLGDKQQFGLLLPPSEYALHAKLRNLGVITATAVQDTGELLVQVNMHPERLHALLAQAGILPELVLNAAQAKALQPVAPW